MYLVSLFLLHEFRQLIPNFTGLKEIDAQYRVSYQSFEKYGATYLPKHKSDFIQRENDIKSLYEKLSSNELNSLEFTEQIAYLFIKEDYYKKIENLFISNDEEDESEKREFTATAKLIFIN